MTGQSSQELPLLIGALNVCYNPDWTADSPTLAVATNLKHYVRVLYDNLVRSEPHDALSAARASRCLRVLGLGPLAACSGELLSLSDFERALGKQFCDRHNVPLRAPQRVTLDDICDWLNAEATSTSPRADWLSGDGTPTSLRSPWLTAGSASSSPRTDWLNEDGENDDWTGKRRHLAAEFAAFPKLARLLLSQEKELEDLKLFTEDLCVAMQGLDAKMLAKQVSHEEQVRDLHDRLLRSEERERALIRENSALQRRLCSVMSSLSTLRALLKKVKPKIDEKVLENCSEEEQKLLDEDCSQAESSYQALDRDRSCAEDSGVVSDEDLTGFMSMSHSSSSGHTDLMEEQPLLMLDEFALPSSSVPSASALKRVKNKLQQLSSKLYNAESKLNTALQKRRTAV